MILKVFSVVKVWLWGHRRFSVINLGIFIVAMQQCLHSCGDLFNWTLGVCCVVSQGFKATALVPLNHETEMKTCSENKHQLLEMLKRDCWTATLSSSGGSRLRVWEVFMFKSRRNVFWSKVRGNKLLFEKWRNQDINGAFSVCMWFLTNKTLYLRAVKWLDCYPLCI